ncbi:MAG: ribonuclease [Acidimicrobiaceae bacterium]|nr:ribonuclease [Acidimicrobiaceae bacterium]
MIVVGAWLWGQASLDTLAGLRSPLSLHFELATRRAARRSTFGLDEKSHCRRSLPAVDSATANPTATTVYTDGACLGNPGPGGWAWAVPGGAHASGAEPATTNNRMELTAALEAARALPGPLVVVSDSTYVVHCFRDRWYEAWERKGWRRKGEPIVNADLWKPLVDLVRSRHGEVSFEWVRGHSGDPMNDVVDRLAVEAAQTQASRSGPLPPTELGAADQPSGRSARAAVPSLPIGFPPGHRVVVLGHRPPELGGYGENPVATQVRRRLTEALSGLRAVHPDLVVLTGLGLGAEQLGAAAAVEAGVAYVAVLAFPNQDEVWPSASREVYRRLLAGAATTTTISEAKPATKQAAGMAIGNRNDWLASVADAALIVWDGKDRHLGETVTSLERRIPDDVWVITPPADR